MKTIATLLLLGCLAMPVGAKDYLCCHQGCIAVAENVCGNCSPQGGIDCCGKCFETWQACAFVCLQTITADDPVIQDALENQFCPAEMTDEQAQELDTIL